jgi:hypothetical protein
MVKGLAVADIWLADTVGSLADAVPRLADAVPGLADWGVRKIFSVDYEQVSDFGSF